MACGQTSFFIVLFFISQLSRDDASQQCGAGGELYSFYQMMFKGHTYKTFKTAPGTLQCRDACLADVRCQSYNVVMFIAICALNNRTKEVRPAVKEGGEGGGEGERGKGENRKGEMGEGGGKGGKWGRGATFN